MNKNIILLLLLSLFLSCSFINATSSQCRGPSTQQAANKRSVSTLNQSEMDELVESELLSLHSAEGLDVEDLEYLSHLTTEELNTLGFRRRFRRAFRRVGRALRRVARAIGRGIKAIGRVLGKVLRGLFRRRAKEIIANSVSSFNGYTGPTHSVLESRRPFIGGGSKTTVVSVATASVLGRRRRGFLRRLGRIARGAFRSPAAISRKIKRGLRGAARAIKKFGQRTARAINEQSLKRGGKIGRFFSAVSKKLSRQSMKRKMKALESKDQAAADGKPANCVACRVDCMKSYSTLGGSMFASCTQQYYYYGCQAVSPCMKTSTSSDDEIEGMVGICAYRNGCKFTNQWRLVGENQIITDRLVGRIRGSGQDPE